MRRRAKDIGDLEFPLEANLPEEVSRDHAHVGERAEITPYADRSLRPLRGKEVSVTGVVLKGGQIAGYEVKYKGKTYYGPKKSFFVQIAMVEDVHLDSAQAKHIRSLLSHYRTQRDYYATSWDGIEALHFELAKASQTAAVEAAGWYKYPSSSRADMDGKDWRLVIPGISGAVAVNCHSISHDNVWTLATTVYSTRDIEMQQLRFLGDSDHWNRVLVWTMAVAQALETDGADYSEIARNLGDRLVRNRSLKALVQHLWPHVEGTLQELFSDHARMAPLSIGFGTIRVEPNHVGRYEHPSDECAYGILTIHPDATKDPKYLFEVVKHEMIHHALAAIPGKRDPHDEDFQRMAKALGLPKKYRD